MNFVTPWFGNRLAWHYDRPSGRHLAYVGEKLIQIAKITRDEAAQYGPGFVAGWHLWHDDHGDLGAWLATTVEQAKAIAESHALAPESDHNFAGGLSRVLTLGSVITDDGHIVRLVNERKHFAVHGPNSTIAHPAPVIVRPVFYRDCADASLVWAVGDEPIQRHETWRAALASATQNN